jgi:signal transduction histidine kinase
VPPQTGRVLIVETKRELSARMQAVLRTAGFTPVATGSVARALHLFAQEEPDLLIVVASSASSGGRWPETPEAEGSSADPEARGTGSEDAYEICRKLKAYPAAGAIPLLLVVPAWNKSAMLRGLEAGADYLLLAPYQGQDLLRSVRTALLNWITEEPREPGVEMIYEDHTYTLPGERGRLARALLSLYEDLRCTKSLLSWQQAEVLDLRNQLRRERHDTDREVLLNEMIQGIAHDFANLLETVGAAAAVISGGGSKAARYRASLESALAQAESLISMLQNCVLFGDEHLSLEAVDAREVVREVLLAAALGLRAPAVHVRVRFEGLPLMRTNAAVLARCLNNLLWNAVQAMPSGGLIEITATVKKGRVILEVSDSGGGISKDLHEQIFEGGRSTKRGHRGMGLSLVRSLVRRSGGDIAIIERAGPGATFAVSFPVAARESLSSEADADDKGVVQAR